MNRPQLKCKDQRLVLAGPVNVATVTPLLAQVPETLALACGEASILEIDCREMTAYDSSAIALLVELHRETEKLQCTLKVQGLGDHLISLINLYGVGWILR